MYNFDKIEIKESLTIDQIFELLTDWGGEPEYTDFGIISTTICHNLPGEGSRKLYYYDNEENAGLFKCYTGCDDVFDIFQLMIKVNEIQKHKFYDLNEAVRFIAYRFGIAGTYIEENETSLEDWEILDNYERVQDIELKDYSVHLKEYNKDILSKFNYNIRIPSWEEEGINKEALRSAGIGFYPGMDQITIPHFDQNGRFIGLRGRTLSKEDAERYGKYRPIRINKELYSHPLGMNLYNLNNSKNNIKIIGKAIIFESEKATLQYKSFFGLENDISVACCGSNISVYQMNMLIEAGAKEIVIALDRQFQEIGDKEFKHLTSNLKKLHNKYHNEVLISFIFDKNKITPYKASPTDTGKEIFLKLFKERILL